MPTWPSRILSSSALPVLPQSVSRGARISGIHAFATACQVARPPVRIRPIHSALEGLPSRLPTDRLPSPLPGISTTATETPLFSRRLTRWNGRRAHRTVRAAFPHTACGDFLSRVHHAIFVARCYSIIFVRPAPPAFFHPDRTLPSPSRAAAVKDGASLAPPKACP